MRREAGCSRFVGYDGWLSRWVASGFSHPAGERQLRLQYRLMVGGQGRRSHLRPLLGDPPKSLPELELKALRHRLHPLDEAIASELLAGPVYGQLPDGKLARLLPLLAQRRTWTGDRRLEISDISMRPRICINDLADATVNGPPIVQLTIGLQAEDRDDIEAVEEGRLIAGPHAYFLRGATAYPVISPAPWELAGWGERPQRTYAAAHLEAGERDSLVRDLVAMGIPASDLDGLAVRRGPPRTFAAMVEASGDAAGSVDDLVVTVRVMVDYGGQAVQLLGRRGASLHLSGEQEAHGALMIERDVVAEEDARQWLRSKGLRFDNDFEAFVTRGEAALAALDPRADFFPAHWRVQRAAAAPLFRRDLAMRAQVQMRPAEQLLELTFDVDVDVDVDALPAVDGGGSASSDTSADDAAVRALVEMKDLLKWLRSGKQYLRLGDGSYVAPSDGFRKTLRIADDIDASHNRVMVSPLCVGLLRAMGDSGAMTAADEATQAWLDEVSSAAGPTPVAVPASLAGVLRDYQGHGLDWLMMLHRHRLAGVLADEMGLGKTLQALALLMKLREQEGPKPSLVVTPTSVVDVWRDEAARFAPELRVGMYYGPPEVRGALDIASYDLVVTSYGILRRDVERLALQHFRYVMLDEAQSAKNAASRNARVARQLASERRLALTGTPLENRAEELWSAFDFLAPGFLGSLRHFRRRYGRPIARGDRDALEMLRARVRPLILRRVKADVAKELPPKLESVVRCEMESAQRALYDHVANQLRESVQRRIEQVGIERVQLDVLTALTRLRQICCAPSLLTVAGGGGRAPASAKLELFEELMREALDSNRCVVVFSQFVQMQKQLIGVVRGLGVEPLWLHGGTRDRAKVVASFQDPSGPPVIVVSLRAGGTGLTLTRADVVMHYDPWWNPAVEAQATDRAHRIGQKNAVTVYKLICARSIEERVVELATRKATLAHGLLAADSGAEGKEITTEDILALLG